MEDTSSSAPASTGGEASSAPSSGSEAGVQSSQASAPVGSAPDGGGDAVAAGEATPGAAGSPAAQFAFLKRQFRDQRHAEEALGSELGMTKGLQRQNAELSKKVAALESALNLRSAGVQVGVQGREQNVPRAPEARSEPKSFAQELAENRDLQLIAEMAEDPKIGLAGALYHMADLMDQRHRKDLESVRGEVEGRFEAESVRQRQYQGVAKAFGVVKNLASSSYPELDESNQSEEAIEARDRVMEILTSRFSPEQIASDPEWYIASAAQAVRNTYGTPIFAQAPGSSGSPSVRAAQAAEAQASAAAAAPLDGSGVPRQRANGQSESPQDRIRRENRELNTRVARTPSGRPLGFDLPS